MLQLIINFFKWLYEKLKNLIVYLWDQDFRVKLNVLFFPVAFYAYISLFETHGLLVAIAALIVLSVIKMCVQYGYDLFHRSKIDNKEAKSNHENASKVNNRLEFIGLAVMAGLTVGSYFMHSDLLLQLKPLIDNCIFAIFLMTLRSNPEFFLGKATFVSEKMLGSMVKYQNEVVTLEPKYWRYCDYMMFFDVICGLGIDITATVLVQENMITEQEWFEFTTYYSKIPSAAFVFIQLIVILYAREQAKPKKEESEKIIPKDTQENKKEHAATEACWFSAWNPFNIIRAEPVPSSSPAAT